MLWDQLNSLQLPEDTHKIFMRLNATIEYMFCLVFNRYLFHLSRLLEFLLLNRHLETLEGDFVWKTYDETHCFSSKTWHLKLLKTFKICVFVCMVLGCLVSLSAFTLLQFSLQSCKPPWILLLCHFSQHKNACKKLSWAAFSTRWSRHGGTPFQPTLILLTVHA